MELRQARLTDGAVEPLLEGLAHEYQRLYGGRDEMTTTRPEEFDAPGGGFVVLADGDRVIAGGGIRRWSADTCEVKRMWTAPDRRREGHAMTILHALEELARRLGYARVRLETGPLQHEALALYARAGYARIPVYGRYPSAHAFELVVGRE
ncbi:MAG: GNAT family N-acetyltransferase [Candidatus Dormibacter sp.]